MNQEKLATVSAELAELVHKEILLKTKEVFGDAPAIQHYCLLQSSTIYKLLISTVDTAIKMGDVSVAKSIITVTELCLEDLRKSIEGAS